MEGKTVGAIAEELTAEGVMTPAGKKQVVCFYDKQHFTKRKIPWIGTSLKVLYHGFPYKKTEGQRKRSAAVLHRTQL